MNNLIEDILVIFLGCYNHSIGFNKVWVPKFWALEAKLQNPWDSKRSSNYDNLLGKSKENSNKKRNS